MKDLNININLNINVNVNEPSDNKIDLACPDNDAIEIDRNDPCYDEFLEYMNNPNATIKDLIKIFRKSANEYRKRTKRLKEDEFLHRENVEKWFNEGFENFQEEFEKRKAFINDDSRMAAYD